MKLKLQKNCFIQLYSKTLEFSKFRICLSSIFCNHMNQMFFLIITCSVLSKSAIRCTFYSVSPKRLNTPLPKTNQPINGQLMLFQLFWKWSTKNSNIHKFILHTHPFSKVFQNVQEVLKQKKEQNSFLIANSINMWKIKKSCHHFIFHTNSLNKF